MTVRYANCHFYGLLIVFGIILQCGKGRGKQGAVIVGIDVVGKGKPLTVSPQGIDGLPVCLNIVLHVLFHSLGVGIVICQKRFQLFFLQQSFLVHLT